MGSAENDRIMYKLPMHRAADAVGKMISDRIGRSNLLWPIVSQLMLNPLIATLKPQSNGPSYSNTVIGTLAVDGWAVTFSTARKGLGGAPARPGPSSLHQMLQPTRQRPAFQRRTIRCGTIIAFGV